MKVALLGATGQSGKEFLQEALKRGHNVLALVRNPDKLDVQHEKLRIDKVNIFDENELARSLKGCDAVASCLGSPGAFAWREITFYQDSMKSIVAGMRKSEIKRLSCITSWCTVRKEIIAREAQFIEVRSIVPQTPRRDVVKFMLDCLENGEWKQKFVSIAIAE